MNRILSAFIFAAILFAGCSSSTGGSSGKSSGKSSGPGDPVATETAIIKTSMGDIEVDLYGNDAPKAVENFVGLAVNKYYDGVLFHRVIPGFMIQTGDPLSRDPNKRAEWGTGGQSIYGPTFEDELNPDAPSSKRGYATGTLAMANAGPNTNGSQFFITVSDVDLPHNYTIFGAVRSGMDVAKKISNVPTEAQTPGGQEVALPKSPVSILSITVK